MKSITTTKGCIICKKPKRLDEFSNAYAYKGEQYKRSECKLCRALKIKKQRRIVKLENLLDIYKDQKRMDRLKNKIKKELNELKKL